MRIFLKIPGERRRKYKYKVRIEVWRLKNWTKFPTASGGTRCLVAVPTGTAGASRYFLDLDARGGETNDEKTRGGPRMPAVLVQGGLPLLTPMYIYIYIYTQTPIGTIRESPLFFFNLFFFFFYSRVFFSLFLVAVLRIPYYERLGTWKFFFFFPFLNFSRECLTLDRALLDVNFSFRSFATLIKA